MAAYQQEIAGEKRMEQGKVWEAPRTLPVRDNVDVLVCGGGPAGIGAALAAAAEGSRVLLLERFGMLGGLWTAGLVNPFFSWKGNGYVVEDLQRQLAGAGAWRTWKFAHTFESEVMRLTLERMLTENGIDFQYYTIVADAIVIDGRVCGVVTESKAGREAILAKVVIDATGDGDIAARSGCRFNLGRDSDGLVQPMTLMFEITGLEQYTQSSSEELFDELASVMTETEKQMFMPWGRVCNVPWLITLPSGLTAVQSAHVYRLNPLNPADLTKGVRDSREQIHGLLAAMRRIPEFASARITQSAGMLGVRESRRILGLDCVTYDDAQAGRKRPDAIVVSRFGLDVHDPEPSGEAESGNGAPMKAFEIPFGSLVPADVEGLLVAGRCISGDHLAHSSYRVTGTAMATGQAAGLAACLAIREEILPSQVDGKTLHAILVEKGVIFLH